MEETIFPLILPRDTDDAELLNAIQGADKCLAEHSLYLTTHFVHENAEEERKIISQLIDGGAKCIMLFPFDESQNQSFFSKIERSGIHMIFLDRMSQHLSGCFIGCDNVKGGYLAASHLIQQGYRKIAFLSRMPMSEAIFCANDLTAVDVMLCAENQSITIPKDIAIIGFDNSCILQRFPYALSTIDQSFYDIGYEAARMACEILEEKQEYNVYKILPVKLIVRNSTPAKTGAVL